MIGEAWPADVSDLDRWLMQLATDRVAEVFLVSGIVLSDRMDTRDQRKMINLVRKAGRLLPARRR